MEARCCLTRELRDQATVQTPTSSRNSDEGKMHDLTDITIIPRPTEREFCQFGKSKEAVCVWIHKTRYLQRLYGGWEEERTELMLDNYPHSIEAIECGSLRRN